MVNSTINVLIKPGSKEEEAYCNKYNINLKRLPNGVTLLGMPCRKDFTSWAHIKYDFQEGSYGNQPGTVHFLEHFINQRARKIAQRNGADVHAWTNQLEIGEEISGIANPKITDYGVWPVLNEIKNALESPLNTVLNPEETILTERDVIKAEIKKRDNNPEFQSEKYFRHVVFSDKNPLRNILATAGTESDVDKLNKYTLEKVQSKVLNSRNLIIGFYTEGQLSIQNLILEELKNEFENFKSGEKNKLDRRLLEEINSDFKSGNHYRFNNGIKNGLLTTEFIWIFKYSLPSIEYFGITFLRQAIATELFLHSRKKGWGYVTSTTLTRPTENLTILRIRIDTRKDDNKELQGGINEILRSVENVTQEIVDNEKKKQAAIPMSVIDRLSWAVGGIKDHGAIINTDKTREIMLQVKARDLTNLINEMITVKPAIITTGDLD